MSLASQISPQATREGAADRAGKHAEIMDRRTALFRETALERCRRVALGTVWSLRPRRVGKLWPLARVWLSDLVAPRRGVPDPEVRAGNGNRGPRRLSPLLGGLNQESARSIK